MVREGIKHIREVGIWKWLYNVFPKKPPDDCIPQKNPEDTPHTKAIKNAKSRGT